MLPGTEVPCYGLPMTTAQTITRTVPAVRLRAELLPWGLKVKVTTRLDFGRAVRVSTRVLPSDVVIDSEAIR